MARKFSRGSKGARPDVSVGRCSHKFKAYPGSDKWDRCVRCLRWKVRKGYPDAGWIASAEMGTSAGGKQPRPRRTPRV